jgi:hypothetical protein
LDKYNPDPDAEIEMEQVPDTGRTEPEDTNQLDIKDIVGPPSDSFKTDKESSNAESAIASDKQLVAAE